MSIQAHVLPLALLYQKMLQYKLCMRWKTFVQMDGFRAAGDCAATIADAVDVVVLGRVPMLHFCIRSQFTGFAAYFLLHHSLPVCCIPFSSQYWVTHGHGSLVAAAILAVLACMLCCCEQRTDTYCWRSDLCLCVPACVRMCAP
jgi:hypothetical protein